MIAFNQSVAKYNLNKGAVMVAGRTSLIAYSGKTDG